MSKILLILEFGGFPLPVDQLGNQGYEVEFCRNMRKGITLLKKMQPELLIAEFNYTSQFRDRDSNLDTILTQIQSQSPHTRVISFVEEEQKQHYERLKGRFPEIRGELYFPFEPSDLVHLVNRVLEP